MCEVGSSPSAACSASVKSVSILRASEGMNILSLPAGPGRHRPRPDACRYRSESINRELGDHLHGRFWPCGIRGCVIIWLTRGKVLVTYQDVVAAKGSAAAAAAAAVASLSRPHCQLEFQPSTVSLGSGLAWV